jgi:predicted ester cyclase
MSDARTVTRRFFEQADQGRTPVELCGAGFTAHFAGLPVMNLESFDEFEAMIRAAFSGIRHDIAELVAEGDTVAVRLTFRGTHTGEFMGTAATGKHAAVDGTAFLHIAGGTVTQLWGFLDQLGLLQQIGALPAPGQAA